MKTAKDKIAKMILRAIQNQDFCEWYIEGGRFDQFIRGEHRHPSEEEILGDIEEMFRLNDLRS